MCFKDGSFHNNDAISALYLHYVRWTVKEIKLFSDEFQIGFLKSSTITLTSKYLHVSIHSESGKRREGNDAQRMELVNRSLGSSIRSFTQTLHGF